MCNAQAIEMELSRTGEEAEKHTKEKHEEEKRRERRNRIRRTRRRRGKSKSRRGRKIVRSRRRVWIYRKKPL